jgi:hypothetical protein
LAIVGKEVVEVAGDLDGLRVLLLQHGLDVLLSALDGAAGALELHIGTAGALLGDIKGDVELSLNPAASLASTADEHAVLGGGNIEDFRDLVLALLDELFDRSDDVIHDLAVALEADGRFGAFRTGETDHSGGAAVSGATGLSDDLADVGTYIS